MRRGAVSNPKVPAGRSRGEGADFTAVVTCVKKNTDESKVDDTQELIAKNVRSISELVDKSQLFESDFCEM
jgi:hypothetical protein